MNIRLKALRQYVVTDALVNIVTEPLQSSFRSAVGE